MDKEFLKGRKVNFNGLTAFDSVMEELRVLKQLEHPNLLWLHEVIEDTAGNINLVTQFY